MKFITKTGVVLKILLIEDDLHIVDFIITGLQAEGYSVETSNNGLDALSLIESGNYNLIILDRMLPGLDGASVCSNLRGIGVSTPILMLTALDAIGDKIDGFNAGADDYLSKPFAFEELVVRIAALMRRSVAYENKPTIMQYQELSLNRETRAVYRGKRPIYLAPKEFYLLEYFLNQPGKVISKTKILSAVWGQNTDPITNIVEVYIRHLRKKINAKGERQLIKTVRGFGYILDQGNTKETDHD